MLVYNHMPVYPIEGHPPENITCHGARTLVVTKGTVDVYNPKAGSTKGGECHEIQGFLDPKSAISMCAFDDMFEG